MLWLTLVDIADEGINSKANHIDVASFFASKIFIFQLWPLHVAF